jgi:hypothetical protein
MSFSKFRSLDAFLTITKKRRLEDDDEGDGESSEPVHIPRNGEVSNAEKRQPEQHGDVDEHQTQTACSDHQITDIGTLSDDIVRNDVRTHTADDAGAAKLTVTSKLPLQVRKFLYSAGLGLWRPGADVIVEAPGRARSRNFVTMIK